MKNFIQSLIYYSIGVLLLIHFIIVGLSVGPDNPIKHVHKKAIDAYVYPFFTQNWNLFAPNPINSNHTMAMRFVVVYPNDTVTTEWFDILAPITEKRKGILFSPLQRVEKYLSSVIEGSFENQHHVLEYMKKHNFDEMDSLKQDSVAAYLDSLLLKSSVHQTVCHYAPLVFEKLPEASTPFWDVKFQYRLIDAEFPRFSNRLQDYHDLKNWDIKHYDMGEYDLNIKQSIASSNSRNEKSANFDSPK
ncbi:MAG: DUF5819 family protein [Saprospiraceae bacterium]